MSAPPPRLPPEPPPPFFPPAEPPRGPRPGIWDVPTPAGVPPAPPVVHTTPAGGTPRPSQTGSLPPRSRANQTTLHDMQSASQEIYNQTGLVPSEDKVERRVILKRVGKTLLAAKSSDVWTKRGLAAFAVLILVGDDLRVWMRAHAEMAYGLVGLGGILLSGALIAARLRARGDDEDLGGGGGPPPSHS